MVDKQGRRVSKATKQLAPLLTGMREAYLAGLHDGVHYGMELGYTLRKKIKNGGYEFA
jgi:hypothetical protein